jgi:hypothetical protein
MEASTQYYLVKGIAIADCVFSLMLLGKTLDLGIPDRMMLAPLVSFYIFRSSFLEQLF